MYSYVPPIDDYRFLLTHVLRFDEAMADVGKDVDADLAVAVLEEAGRLCADRLQPLNREGDEQGSRLVDGAVITPPGFADAYREFVAAGWPALAASPDHGGQGLPFILQLWLDEMLSATNLSFGLFPGLTRGAVEAIIAHASEDLKAAYLAPLVSGEWTGAMALTESGAGTDLALLKTKAVPLGDGRHAVTGQKIFISSGDHDFGGNIIHLVLARLPDAPPGVKGISLFLVPKFLPDTDGGFTIRNSMSVGALEKKMGIHAQPTCVMNYDEATGWLVGEPHRGLAAMFTMMNAARLNVGMEGVAVAEAAYQKALAYVRERKQGGALIIEHPDVRRMLTTMRAKIQAGRAVCYACAVAADAGDKAREDLLTPLAKAWCTDLGVEVASLGVQIHGGMGFVEEGGAAQFYRDARIAPIYEGTNGIQAIDLYGRKLLSDRGEAMRALIADTRAIASAHPRLASAADALERATDHMLSAVREDALTGASAYLALAGDVAGAMLWAQGLQRTPNPKQSALFNFYCESVLTRAEARVAEIRIGASALCV